MHTTELKNGARNKAGNYSHICSTSIASILMESFIKESITIHITAKNLLSIKHYGFINGQYTKVQLLSNLNLAI